MLLAIDIGNTHIVIGVYRGRDLVARWRAATDRDRTADECAVLLRNFFAGDGLALTEVEGAIISSVVPPMTPTFCELVSDYLGITPLVVGPDIETGVEIRYDNPHEVGADRVVNALAASRLYGTPAIVVDFGTATTFDAVSAAGEYLGGAIAPGIGISVEALFRYTAKLPRIELAMPRRVVGKTTVESMQSGVLFGYVGLVEGLVARIREELGGQACVIATGGLAHVIAKEAPCLEVVDENLTLEGLRLMYEMNQLADG